MTSKKYFPLTKVMMLRWTQGGVGGLIGRRAAVDNKRTRRAEINTADCKWLEANPRRKKKRED